MTSPARGSLRLARGAVLALACTVVAAAVHAAGGGGVPPLAALALVTLAVGGSFVLLADRQRGLPAITGAALAAQGAFHVGFALGMAPGLPHAGSPMHAGTHPGAGIHGLHGRLAMHLVSGPAAHPVAQLLADPRMAAGHVLGALVMGWLVWRGETDLWALFNLLRFVVVPAPAPCRVPDVCGPVPAPHPRSAPVAALINSVRPLRGPPFRFC